MVDGGLILKKQIANVDVSWEWYNEQQGLVQWNFTNNAGVAQSGILFRNNYPFGDAFWPMYENNSKDFGTSFTTLVTPLVDNGVQNNSMPLGIYKNPDGSYFVAFIFTFSPGQSWSCIEGGFSGITPSAYSFIPANKLSIEQFQIFYDSGQCQGYNQQSGSNLACPNNPISVTSAVMQLNQQVKPLFNDTFELQNGTTKPSCLDMIIQGIASLNGNEIIAGLECAFGTLPKGKKAIIQEKF